MPSGQMRRDILEGREINKPGFIRLNFSVLLPEDKVQFILDSVLELAADADRFVENYEVDTSRAIFSPRAA